MPSSTVWRRRPEDFGHHRRSPSPPTAFIEPLSPDLDHSPRVLERTQYSRYTQSSGHTLNGLGLSYSARNDDGLDLGQPSDSFTQYTNLAHFSTTTTATNGNYDFSHSRREPTRPHTRDGISTKRPRARGHARYGSTIDDLASAAIATSPSFANGSSSLHTIRPATSYEYNQSYTDGERPYKRIRSEKILSHEWSPRQNGSGSQMSDEQKMYEVELLLSLRNGFDFKHSPPSAQKPFPTTPRAMSDSSRSGPKDEMSVAGVDRTPSLDEVKMKNSPSRLRTSFNIRVPIGSPQAPEPEPLTSPLGRESSEMAVDEPNTLSEAVVEEANAFLGSATEVLGVIEKPALTSENEPEEKKAIPSCETPMEHSLPDPTPTREPKQPRRVRAELLAEVCAKCLQFQREPRSEDGDSISWIKCSPCNRWFHAACAGFKDKRETQTVDKFVCAECKPSHGETTFVRKSSRARTAIDYESFNQGLIKSSAETSMHHYIQPIKEGKIQFHPDNYPRIRPELVTAEYFELADGMKRPLVIPSYLNPRYGDPEPIDGDMMTSETAESKEEPSDSNPTLESDFIDEEVIDLNQDRLGMVMPRDLTVRKVAELYGLNKPVIVIDVKSQQSHSKWVMGQWADYYETTGDKKVLNVISLEITESKLSRIIRRPKIVRDIDLQDLVWPDANKSATYKPVQLYCLMSVADSYTDFHIDFGGSSVYYHILKGKKTFFFIPPEEKNLRKYEDWCNSDTQDTTFLGDLTGDCSRVDLAEGDTMFIPAGWIHAVWTPEDSLVIGGNFLTRTDYEMQLKIVEVEKNTKVAPSFRYPFFQKVMWYTLITYLTEDPIPAEVIQEFADDEEFMFLRANPVWEEIGEFENLSEPGDPNFNARYYSKAEIRGLPALRDYLYRTALVYNDVPVVPPVTKETAKRMKNSIPKTHGEPMDLIKQFGLWCAWKTGNVIAPSWAHPDAVTMQKLAEKREKLTKPEIFRIPPERSSSRKPSHALDFTTPAKNGSRADGEDGARSGSSSRPSGLGPKRSACDACRKRRIRCRHREDIEATTPSEFSRARSFSNVTIEVPRLSMVSGMATADSNGSPPQQEYPEFAQAVLATMEIQTGEVADPSMLPTTPSSKKGRSKACDECRKSKRRCVHDEHGNVDPTKAAEPSKPRGSASTKRPSLPNDQTRQPPSKKPKLEADVTGQAQEVTETDFNSLIDPALMADVFPDPAVSVHPEITYGSAAPRIGLSEEKVNETIESRRSPDLIVGVEMSEPVEKQPLDPALNEPFVNSALPEAVIKPEQVTLALEHVPSQTPAASLASPPDSNASNASNAALSPTISHEIRITTSIEANGNSEKAETSPNDFYTPVSTSRHSSRQPKLIDRYVPEDSRVLMKPAAKQAGAKVDRRHSSSGVSGESGVTGVKSRRSSSNTSGNTHQLAQILQNGGLQSRENSVRPVSRGSAALSSEADADEVFARELQAQENGLRRRISGRL